MILRNLTTAIRKRDWVAVGLDFLIIVLGILMAFQITECSHRSALHSQQRAAVRDMLGESVEAVRYLRTVVDTADSRIARQDEAVAALASKDIGGLTEDEIGNALISLVHYPAITPPRDVYDTLSGSGNLDLIADRGTRREISRYYSQLRFVEGQLDYVRNANVARFDTDHAGITATYDAQAPGRRHIEVNFAKLSADAQYRENAVNLLQNQLEFQRYRRDLLAQAEAMCLVLGQAAKLPCVAYQEPQE